MNLRSKRGAALLQVLIVTAILAGMSAMILRLSLSRTITSRQTRHVINAQTVIESCMAEVNALWAAKTPSAYARDLEACQMCKPDEDAGCAESDNNPQDGIDDNKEHFCSVELNDITYTVRAEISKVEGGPQPCRITYTITNATGDARQTL